MKKQSKILLGFIALLALPIFLFAQTQTQTQTQSEAETATQNATEKINVKESLEKITSSIANLDQEAKQVESEIRLQIKEAIDDSIIKIRAQEEIEAYILQRAVDDARTQAFDSLRRVFGEAAPADLSVIDEVRKTLDISITEIEQSLEVISDVEVDLADANENINQILTNYEQKITEKKEIIDEKDGDLLQKDTDGDGLSDYEEKYIYNTDPNNSVTAGDQGMTDGEKVAAGINPRSETSEKINYADPRTDKDAHVTGLYTIKNVEKIDGKIRFEGKALPNSYITVYIYSTPVIVTVKTDRRGEWTYTLDKELEDGKHEVYVATVNNSGQIVARSNSIPFTKSAEAAALGSFASVGDTPEEGTGNFFQDNFVLIVIAIVLIGIVVTMSLFGRKPKTATEMDEPKNPVKEYAEKNEEEKIKNNE